jgi:deoxyribonuclease (pyrimidine dimer)
MTRINCIPVSYLSKKHAFAEFREITRVLSALKKSQKAGTLKELPNSYRLGLGHVKFFYNKAWYLTKRTQKLYLLCKNKFNMNIQFKQYKFLEHPEEFRKDWEPTVEDKIKNLNRLIERSSGEDREKYIKVLEFHKRLLKILK